MWKLGEFCGQKSPKTGKSCRFCLFLFVIEGQSFSLRLHCMVENFLLFGTAAAGAGLRHGKRSCTGGPGGVY